MASISSLAADAATALKRIEVAQTRLAEFEQASAVIAEAPA